MKKVAITSLLISGFFLGFYFGEINKYNRKIPEVLRISPTQAKKQSNKVAVKSRSIFVPSWSLKSENKELSNYDELIYFGITPDYLGINKNETGYYGIPIFLKLAEGKKKLITLRMIDDDLNYFILGNKQLQKKIIQQTLEIVEQNKFDGVVLDLEISGLYSQDLTNQINNFAQLFYSEVNKNYRQFYLAIYGDNFFRKRPFDLSVLTRNSDGIMIMAYDFHKSRGEPGPNFPYDSGVRYQYNFKKMISDFSKVVAKEKITVIFGMFGYDWLVDEKKRPIRQAEALSLNQIAEKFFGTSLKRSSQTYTTDVKCYWQDCVIKRDLISKETEINYVVSAEKPDDQDIYRIDYHIVWFEDEESVKIKTDYLREQGISNISYWANGYF
ncbi:hypothetical protein A2767_00815 [Candidatus Roizmanbacteria bacterium RIFCSPHIGHO2_01_FULL_35_10]|uniref:GH18 domain-containing protein n=1 Tax=Candidatus Roizmanbacteria bacterium RIFCSPLOWO2_01_FULL_35_13 TaxID=1802055 RepID=A0A1F7ID98_9BACT|nr:MAG: hypothetical protein A2767_00815 [Candidatus Roizmanbacteria bacterium RIFCSPHIGHO2_01_FULL_35_10]OGK41344.1 MAG: hypothetical protein A3A74_03360 [Candidatus Roizmanbacteria bacterium RIFCSPLOWO2_01_FULL_35_13]